MRFISATRFALPDVDGPRGAALVVRHHPTRQSVGYFGAVRLRDGKLVTRREDVSFNGQTFWSFLQELETVSREEGRRIVVITDNAKFHHGLGTSLGGRAMQTTLPWTSCHLIRLNSIPIERVWKLLRRLRLHNPYFATLPDVVTAVEAQLAIWSQPNDALRKLCDTFG